MNCKSGHKIMPKGIRGNNKKICKLCLYPITENQSRVFIKERITKDGKVKVVGFHARCFYNEKEELKELKSL